MKVYTRLVMRWDGAQYVTEHEESYEHSGPVSLCCGASQQQKDIGDQQAGFYKQMTQQAQQVFGSDSAIYNDLVSTFLPTLQAGPNQRGFSNAESAALKSQAITQVGQGYKNAAAATGNAIAAQGGGNTPGLTSGANIGVAANLAASAANQQASELNQIEQADWATGRQNYATAAQGIEAAPNTFNSATNFASAANGSGSDAATTANQISTQNNSWVQSVTGALGGIAGAATTGGLNLLKKNG